MMTEKEIQYLIKKKEIPYQVLQDRLIFNKQQIIDWALNRNHAINISANQNSKNVI